MEIYMKANLLMELYMVKDIILIKRGKNILEDFVMEKKMEKEFYKIKMEML